MKKGISDAGIGRIAKIAQEDYDNEDVIMEVANDVYGDVLFEIFLKAEEILDNHPIYKVYDLTESERKAVKNKIADFIELDPTDFATDFISSLRSE